MRLSIVSELTRKFGTSTPQYTLGVQPQLETGQPAQLGNKGCTEQAYRGVQPNFLKGAVLCALKALARVYIQYVRYRRPLRSRNWERQALRCQLTGRFKWPTKKQSFPNQLKYVIYDQARHAIHAFSRSLPHSA